MSVSGEGVGNLVNLGVLIWKFEDKVRTYLLDRSVKGYRSEFVVDVLGDVTRGSSSISLLSASRKERSISSPTGFTSVIDSLQEPILRVTTET